VAYVHRGYWIDIGTPEKYVQVHHDIMDGRCCVPPFAERAGSAVVSPHARLEEGVVIEGPCFVDEGVVVKTGARIGAYSVIGRHCHIEERAVVEDAIVWANSRVSQDATVRGAILGRQCHVGRFATVGQGVVLGDKSVATDFSRL
jgi:NDP-sugar pyrophosphorylase family protein